MSVTVQRTVTGDAARGIYLDEPITVSVLVPDDAVLDDLLDALRRLDAMGRLAVKATQTCRGCYTRPGSWHRPDCPNASDTLIESARRVALEAGMRP